MCLPTLPISLNLEQIQQFCQVNQIRKLSLFGSVLREDFTPESDVDILVEFQQGKTPGLAIVSMQDELSSIIKRQVDLRTIGDLSRYFREQVQQESLVIYELKHIRDTVAEVLRQIPNVGNDSDFERIQDDTASPVFD